MRVGMALSLGQWRCDGRICWWIMSSDGTEGGSECRFSRQQAPTHRGVDRFETHCTE